MKDENPGRRSFLSVSAKSAAGLTMVSALPRTVLGANDRLRVGLIGCGSRGNYLLDETLKIAASHNVEVAALCDVWTVNLGKTRDRLATLQATKPRTFARYMDLLTMPGLDGVLVATPDFAHTPILIEATKLGKDAFVEKPMASVLEHARTALDLVKQKGTIVQVGTQRRSDRRHQEGARLMQSGVLGKVSEVETAWHDAGPRWARDYSDVRAADVDWDQYLMYLPKEPFRPERYKRWHFYKDFTVGTPGLLGSHLVDVATWFMDDPLPVSAVAHGGVYVWKDGREHADTLDCVIEYPKGFLVNYSTRLGNKHAIPEVLFYGTKGTFDTETWTARGEGGGEGALAKAITVPDPRQAAASPAPAAAGGTNDLAAAQPDMRVEGEGHVRNWIECVRSRQTPTAPIEAGYAHSVMSILCFKAWDSGRRQVYDPVTREMKAG